MKKHTMETLVQRLDRLEREDRRLKGVGLMVLIGIVALVLMGQATPSKVEKLVEAEKFVLRDEKGKIRATLAIAADGVVSLSLAGTAEKPGAVLAAARDGASTLILYNKDGNVLFRAP